MLARSEHRRITAFDLDSLFTGCTGRSWTGPKRLSGEERPLPSCDSLPLPWFGGVKESSGTGWLAGRLCDKKGQYTLKAGPSEKTGVPSQMSLPFPSCPPLHPLPPSLPGLPVENAALPAVVFVLSHLGLAIYPQTYSP